MEFGRSDIAKLSQFFIMCAGIVLSWAKFGRTPALLITLAFSLFFGGIFARLRWQVRPLFSLGAADGMITSTPEVGARGGREKGGSAVEGVAGGREGRRSSSPPPSLPCCRARVRVCVCVRMRVRVCVRMRMCACVPACDRARVCACARAWTRATRARVRVDHDPVSPCLARSPHPAPSPFCFLFLVRSSGASTR